MTQSAEKSSGQKKIQPRDLIGRNVTLYLKDREETRFENVTLNHFDSVGLTLTYNSRGKEFAEFIPLENVNYLSCRLGSEFGDDD